MPEFEEGFGTLHVSEPTTVCDAAITFSHIKEETPALKEIEEFFKQYFGEGVGTYDEEGRWRPPCSLRVQGVYSNFTPSAEVTDEKAKNELAYNLWDAAYSLPRHCCVELQEQLKTLHHRLEEEMDAERKRKWEEEHGH